MLRFGGKALAAKMLITLLAKIPSNSSRMERDGCIVAYALA
jgi:hypothetical protein